MSEYTPTTDEVFEATLYTWVDWKAVYAAETAARDGFDRWLAKVKAEAQVEALRGLVRCVDALDLSAAGMDEVADWVMRRANNIAREAGIETGENDD